MPSLSILLALSAHAFAPGTPGAGIEPTRIRTQHGETQAKLLRESRPWAKFAATDGRGWQARFDETTGTPRWMWGAGIPVADATTGKAEIVARVRGLLERHRELLGFESGTLSPGVANYSASFDTWYVEFAPLRDGTAVYRSAISARIKHGNLVLLTVGTAPDAPVVGEWTLSSDSAVALAIANGPASGAVHTERSVVPQLLERKTTDGLALVRTWMVRTRTQEPPGIWVSFVDAGTGTLLSVHNEVRFVAGTITGEHHERNPGTGFITSPIPLAYVEGDSDSDITNETGDFDVTSSPNYRTVFEFGDYVTVNNEAGANGFLERNNTTLNWNSNSASQAEIDTYVFTNQIRVWGERVDASVPIVSDPIQAFVNINDVCNAFYDGNINFFSSGSGCNNTGENADVVYHEWGHGFHATSLQAGVFDGALSEGAGDITSFLQTGDNLMAPFFQTNGGAIRDVEPNRVYPQDVVGQVHEDGLIFGGAMWDTWGILVDDLGSGPGTDVIEQAFAGLLKGGPTIPDSYFEALVADDDDGDLANGTPHQCQLLEGFGLHGLGELVGGASFLAAHEPLTFEAEGVPTRVEVTLSSSAPTCVTVTPDNGNVHWRVDGGAWQQDGVTVSGQDVTGEIPALPLGAFVEYWIGGRDTEGNDWQAPTAGEFAPYSFFVGDVIEIACEDFDGTDGGYQHELVSGEAGDGADDWQWGAPFGLSGDPSDAFSGNKVWGNDLGGGDFNGGYQPDKVNRLWSPVVDTLWYTDVFLQYRRWLNIEDGTYDQAIITANGTEVWSNHTSNSDAGEHHQDGQWVSHAVDLDGHADQTTVEVGWELYSDAGLEFGGWTLDDVCLYAPATPDNRLAIVDFVVTDTGGPISLSWTNPIHAPVEQVVVVRKTDSTPTAFDDGEVVARVVGPATGSRSEEVHGNLDGSSGFYAVYASDGTDWLSWTIDGWNAGFAAPNDGGTIGTEPEPDPDDTDVDTDIPTDEVPDEDGDEAATDKGGCGCDASPRGAFALWSLVGLLAVFRRRGIVKA